MTIEAAEGSRGPRAGRFQGLTWMVLLSLGLFNLVRGAFHWLAPDSGAGSVAGFDLSLNGAAVIYLLALAGVSQLAFGMVDIYVALRHREFVAPVLSLEAMKNVMLLLTDYLIKPPGIPIPGRFAHWAVLVVSVVTLAIGALAKEDSRGTRP